ncbi:hypothetical protein AB205_0082000, partial [Aquarana catesbeiana]
MEQLVQLQCPAGGVPGGKGRIVPWGSDLYVCGGSEFLHVFSLERRAITAVYLFPSKISHMEIDRGNNQLYALCAPCGVFLLEWDETGRLLQEPDCTSQRGGATVHHIGPGFCCLREGSASSFTLAGDALVLAVQLSEEWKVRVFPRKSLGYGEPNPSPTREVTLSGKAVTPNPPPQPVLCCVSLWKEDKVNGLPSTFLLGARLFTRLFGVDLAMLDSPVILCGFPDGRVAYFPLKSPGSPLCLAVLHWLLSMDMVKEQSLAEVQGVTPDGKDFSLQVQEISVLDVAAAGIVPAIEIQILSSHLHVVAALHLAVISHF